MLARDIPAGAPPEDTLPTVNPKQGRAPVRLVGDVHGLTHVGCVRQKNEDHFLVADLQRSVHLRHTSLPRGVSDVADAEGSLLMVADGMGGHGDGELASAVTLDSVLRYVTYSMPWSKAIDDSYERVLLSGFAHAVAHCQQRLKEVAARKGASSKLGTTLTVAYVSWPDAYVAHVGDSRCYVWRQGQLQQVTHDHTLAEQLREKVGDRADLTQFDHVLVNAVGGDGQQPNVEGHRLRLTRGDRVLLCSDGLHGELGPEAIAQALGSGRTAAEACQRLVQGALDAGGRDNVTALVAFY